MSQLERPPQNTLQPGDEFEPVEMVLTPEIAAFFLIGADERDPMYTEASPFGGPVMPPAMIHWFSIRSRWTHHSYTQAGLHVQFNAEYFSPVKIGEKVKVKGKCLASYVKRGRRYLEYQNELYGGDGRLCTRYVHTHTHPEKGAE